VLTSGQADVFYELESNVRSYCRAWPAVFDTAQGSRIRAEDGREFLDFFSGAGALNYGHNNPALKDALLEFIQRDGLLHGLDVHTTTKRHLLETFRRLVLSPRGLDYRVMFPGPTGTNAVEAALKLARKVTGRPTIAHFSGSFHGMSLGSLAMTSNPYHRAAAGVPLLHGLALPYDDPSVDVGTALDELDRLLTATGTGVLRPAAVIVETVQGEGGVNVARPEWLRGLAGMCQQRGILLIADDIQMGCGRTGEFFSFEESGITPDIVTLSKSISGYGLPMALVLMRRELDVWEPGEHNGTFRGNNAAFVTATAALEHYWTDDALTRRVTSAGSRVSTALTAMAASGNV
jgi:diaminobutyrate-2-oxoglutarate transaminase